MNNCCNKISRQMVNKHYKCSMVTVFKHYTVEECITLAQCVHAYKHCITLSLSFINSFASNQTEKEKKPKFVCTPINYCVEKKLTLYFMKCSWCYCILKIALDIVHFKWFTKIFAALYFCCTCRCVFQVYSSFIYN